MVNEPDYAELYRMYAQQKPSRRGRPPKVDSSTEQIYERAIQICGDRVLPFELLVELLVKEGFNRLEVRKALLKRSSPIIVYIGSDDHLYAKVAKPKTF